MTAKDLVWRKNCTYVAFVHDDTITYLEVVEKGREHFSIQKISSSSKEAIELDQEVEKFIASRREVVAPDEDQWYNCQVTNFNDTIRFTLQIVSG